MISYSLYLWHWPILAFLRYLFVDLTPTMAIGAVTATFILAVASYWLVERPARRVSWSFRWVAAGFALAPLAVVVAAASWLTLTDGFGPFGARYQRHLAKAEKISTQAGRYPYVCQRYDVAAELLDDERCIINGDGQNPKEVRVLLWGDSNAAHYIGVLGTIAEALGFAFLNAEHTSCPPMIAPTIPYSAPQFAEACAQSQKAVERELNRFDTIILGAAWQGNARQAGFEPDFRSTVAELRRRGHRVILLGQIPPIPGFDRRCEQKALKVRVLRCRDRSSNVETRPRPFNDVLKGLADEMEGVTYFDIEDMICRNGTCSAYFGSKPLYYDPGHLSMSIMDRRPPPAEAARRSPCGLLGIHSRRGDHVEPASGRDHRWSGPEGQSWSTAMKGSA